MQCDCDIGFRTSSRVDSIVGPSRGIEHKRQDRRFSGVGDGHEGSFLWLT